MIIGNPVSPNEDIDQSVYEQILQFIRLRVTETYAFPPEIVQVDGITIATLGNFSASVGKPKSKKTFNVTAIVASAYVVKRYSAIRHTCRKDGTRCFMSIRSKANAIAIK